MVGDHIYLNIGGIFSLKPFNLTGIAGGLLFISLSFDEPLLKQYSKNHTKIYTQGGAPLRVVFHTLDKFYQTTHFMSIRKKSRYITDSLNTTYYSLFVFAVPEE